MADDSGFAPEVSRSGAPEAILIEERLTNIKDNGLYRHGDLSTAKASPFTMWYHFAGADGRQGSVQTGGIHAAQDIGVDPRHRT
jgi:hypothetical protein